ncbi:MAG: hypothetical protein EBX54_10990, partial [Betaproteobacteria bacterium]|nr:hypothetical protein [Betaproteobacteria bacterium]
MIIATRFCKAYAVLPAIGASLCGPGIVLPTIARSFGLWCTILPAVCAAFCLGLAGVTEQWPHFRLKSCNDAVFKSTLDHPLNRAQFA